MIDLLLQNPMGFAQELVLLAPGFLLAVTLHELAHGLVADRLGDPTARLAGRLTLNPLPHIDPVGALAFLLAGFGWAKPVPVNAYHLRHPVRDMAAIAAAGPVANFLVAFVGLVVLLAVSRIVHTPFLAVPLTGMLKGIYEFNLVLGIFNLIPLPPLDGGHFLPYILPRRARARLHGIAQYGPFLLLLLVMSGATRYLVWPVFRLLSDFYLAIARLMF